MFLTHKFHAILSTCRKPAISPNSILEFERLPWGENSVLSHHRQSGLCEHAATLGFRRPVPKAHRANQCCECFVPRVLSDSRMEHLRDIVNDMTTVEFTIRHHGSYLEHRRELIREDGDSLEYLRAQIENLRSTWHDTIQARTCSGKRTLPAPETLFHHILRDRFRDQLSLEPAGPESVHGRCMERTTSIVEADAQADQPRWTGKERDRIPSFFGEGRACVVDLRSGNIGAQFAYRERSVENALVCVVSGSPYGSGVLGRGKE